MSSPQAKGYNVNLAPITGLATIPSAIAQSGTLTADSTSPTKLTSDGGATPTCDFSVIKSGDYILIGSEIRKVLYNHAGNDNNPRIDIEMPFTSRPVAATWSLVPTKKFSKVVIQNTGGTAGKVNGQNIADTDTPMIFEADQGLEAIIVDGTGTSLQVLEAY